MTASAISLTRTRGRESLNVCAGWFQASPSDRIASLYALFIVSRPSWMTRSIQLADVFHYVELAREAAAHVTPAPTTTDAIQHLLQDAPAPAPQQPARP